MFEQNVQPEHFGSIPDAMWWTVVADYGGVRRYCANDSGRQTRCHINCADGVCVVALLTGIVATGFTNQCQCGVIS